MYSQHDKDNQQLIYTDKQIKFTLFIYNQLISFQCWIMSKQLINSECQTHKKTCEYMCCYSKCQRRLICQKCRREHLDIHPVQFVYQLSNLAEIHAYNKVDKLKQVLIKEKLSQESIIKNIYQQFQTILHPIIQKIKRFTYESRNMIDSQLTNYLRSNKFIIDETQKQIKKSDTKQIRGNPNKMLQQTINEAEIINRRQGRLIENGQSYKWYSDTTKEMCFGIALEIKSMINVVMKIIDNSLSLQRIKYSSDKVDRQNHHQLSFHKRYHASTEVGIQRIKLEGDVLQSKKILQMKEHQILKSKKQIRDKVIKISQLQQKLEGLTGQLQAWQQKKQRQQRQKMLALQKQKKLKQQQLIKDGIIGSNGKSLCFQRKTIQQQIFPLILQLVPNPVTLDISNHCLTKQQLQMLLGKNSIQILKFNFTKIDEGLIIKFLKAYSNLMHLQLNSCDINDDILFNISKYFSPRLKNLYLIDNHITDQGLEQIFFNKLYVEQLYVSYNKLTSKSIEILSKHLPVLKVLHIAKTQLKQKGGSMIGRYLKQIQELFIGSTGISKQGFLAICKNCTQLKRMSIVANEITTQVVTQILLGLKDLQWLDLSYCNLNKNDIEKIQKLKIFNKDLEIIFGL